ncbi:MAG: hypothetical protein ACREPR_24070, partial [Brasilonema sp.]
NYGFQRSQRADLLAAIIQAISDVPVLIAMTYETYAELRALITLAFEFKRLDRLNINSSSPAVTVHSPQFILVQKQKDEIDITLSTLKKNISSLSRPVDLWGVNLKIDSQDIEALGCPRDSQSQPDINGYRYRLYHCRA